MTVHTVADYFLTLGDPEAGDSISNIRIQKLLYYAQGVHLATTNEPLFDDPIEAWRFAPVVPDVYHRFKTHGFENIPAPRGVDASTFSADQRSTLNDVNEAYGQFSARETNSDALISSEGERRPNCVRIDCSDGQRESTSQRAAAQQVHVGADGHHGVELEELALEFAAGLQ